jgi:hypothetical protein
MLDLASGSCGTTLVDATIALGTSLAIFYRWFEFGVVGKGLEK